MHTPMQRVSVRGILIAISFVIVILVYNPRAALAQESILANARYSSVSVLDLATQNLKKVINPGYFDWSIAVGPNPRLAFVGGAYYISVVDVSIGREIKRIGGVYGLGFSAFSSDGKLLLLADNSSYSLDVIDAVGLKFVRQVNLLPAMGTGAIFNLSSVVVVGTQAYVTTNVTDPNSPAIAVVDLKTFTVKPIPIAAGFLDGFCCLTPNAAATPDGKYVVMVETYSSDFSYHLLYISTTTNQVVKDYTIATDPFGILVNPVGNPEYAYVLGISTFPFSATVLDLQTGQLLPQTEVELDQFFVASTTAAINPEGTRLVVGGSKVVDVNPNPNLVVVDTAKMLTDPSHAVVGQAIIAGGLEAYGTAIASVMTTPPSTAPTVTGVTPPTVNNATANVVQITGTNFAPGAQVRIGTMPPLPATVINPNSLQVTVPQNAPAQASLDVIVTNPNLGDPQAQQYQSGMLASQFTITTNPAFQPKHQFAAFDTSDWSVAVYEFGLGHMINVSNGFIPLPFTFNGDGAEIYAPSYGQRGVIKPPQVLDFSPAKDVVQAQISLPSGERFANLSYGPDDICASTNPATGKPVVYLPVRTFANHIYDLAMQMIDTDSTSPTFNQIIRTISAELNSHLLLVGGCAATPDGKYVYTNYYDFSTQKYEYGIFDMVHSAVTIIDSNTLGAAQLPNEMYVAPNGQSLLLNAVSGAIAIFDISGNNATHPVPVTTITGMLPPQAGPPNYLSWQVVGDRLFALVSNIVIAFDFDRPHSTFTQLAMYTLPTANVGNLAVSPDGALVYVALTDSDMITVLDANLLVGHQPPLITNIGAFRAPYQVAVSPVVHSQRDSHVGTVAEH